MLQMPRKLGRHWFLLVPVLLFLSAVLMGYGARLTGLADAVFAHPIDPTIENIHVEGGMFRCNVTDYRNSALQMQRYRVRRDGDVVLISVYSPLIHPAPDHLSGVDRIAFQLQPGDRSVAVMDQGTRRVVWSR